MLSNKKSSTLRTLFFTLLLISMLIFVILQCVTDSTGANQNGDRSDLVINEFMADNGVTLASPNGTSPDWIEIFNTGSETIDLTGMYLTDDLNDPTRWQFPEGTTLGPKEYLVIWAKRNGGELFASFGLNANGEEIGLFDSDGSTLIDSVVFLKQIQDVSYGRIPDGGSSWNYLLSATPGYSNQNPSVENKSSVWSLVILIIAFAAIGIVIFVVKKIRAGAKN
jgi:hypothetical protein